MPYEQGIATRISYIRLSQEDRERVDLEAHRLGIPQTELWRRMLDLYFDVLAAVPTSGPELTPRQAENLLKASTSDAGKSAEDKKFNFTGEE